MVAAVGNSDQAREQPWKYASYPAALPHVLGVSALARDGSVPMFSNRDDLYNDIAAPGDDLFSTLPYSLTALASDVSRAGLLRVRTARVPPGSGDVVRVRDRHRRRDDPPQQPGRPERGPDPDDPGALGGRPDARDGLPPLHRRPRRAERLGEARHRRGGHLEGAVPRTGPLRAERRRRNRAVRVPRRRSLKRRATVDFWDDQNDVYAVRLKKGRAAARGALRERRGSTSTSSSGTLERVGWTTFGR